jgi:hypothetical protein
MLSAILPLVDPARNRVHGGFQHFGRSQGPLLWCLVMESDRFKEKNHTQQTTIANVGTATAATAVEYELILLYHPLPQ